MHDGKGISNDNVFMYNGNMDNSDRVKGGKMENLKGWRRTQGTDLFIDVETGEPYYPVTYTCRACGYETGRQAENFNYCPICGDKKGDRMKVTVTLNKDEIREALARDYGVKPKDVSIVTNAGNHEPTAIIDNIDLTAESKETDELSTVKERINEAMKKIADEMLIHEHPDDDNINTGMALAAAIFADTLGIDVVDFE